MAFDPRLMWDATNERSNGSRPAPGLSHPKRRSRSGSGHLDRLGDTDRRGADRGVPWPTSAYTERRSDDHHQFRDRRGTRGRKDQATLSRRRGRHGAERRHRRRSKAYRGHRADGTRTPRHFLRERTTFWIVKPRIGVGGVSGLGTLLSGAYIGLAPGRRGHGPRVRRAGRTAPDQRQHAGPRVRADDADPRLAQPRRTDLLSRHRYRAGDDLQPQRGGARARRQDIRQGAIPQPDPYRRADSGTRVGSMSAPARRASTFRSPRSSLFWSAASRSIRHSASSKPRCGRGRDTLPALRPSAGARPGPVHRESPLSNLLRRLGPRPQSRRSGGVSRDQRSVR